MILPRFQIRLSGHANEPTFVEAELHPFRSLWAAVILQAVKDCDLRPSHAMKPTEVAQIALLRHKAKYWILSDSQAPQSFLWDCEEVHIDPQKIREKILRIERESLRLVPVYHKKHRRAA